MGKKCLLYAAATRNLICPQLPPPPPLSSMHEKEKKKKHYVSQIFVVTENLSDFHPPNSSVIHANFFLTFALTSPLAQRISEAEAGFDVELASYTLEKVYKNV